eukprot:1691751-Lingulodinium_polyedra.AAC.1
MDVLEACPAILHEPSVRHPDTREQRRGAGGAQGPLEACVDLVAQAREVRRAVRSKQRAGILLWSVSTE